MGERKINFVENEFYHVYNRGNSKQIIFKDRYDYERFQQLLYLCNSEQNFKIEHLRRDKQNFFTTDRKQELVSIGAYCLMPNHYHILLTPRVENGISQFMKKLGTGYSMYFNNRHERTGSLFEGKFKAEWVDSDEYLRYLYSYIYLNPMKLIDGDWKQRIITDSDILYLRSYEYSSYYDYCASIKRREQNILTNKSFPDYFSNINDPRIIHDWFSVRENLIQEE